MLERFDAIKKVGLFEDYAHSSGCELGEATLIYGENGVGKSTLAAILDSLRERNAAEILRRRSLPGDVAPTATITLNGKVYRFDGHDWDDQPPYDTLDVFYPGFVSRNVHAASGVETEHRRNLCEFALGRNAVAKVRRLADADGEAREAGAEKRRVELELEKLIKKPDTLDTFLGLANDPSIDQRLEKARTELKQAQSREAILARAVPQAVTLPTVDRAAITGFLERSAEGIAANAAAVVREHIDQRLDADGENWLAYGARHVEADNTCPFCAKDTTGSSLVTAIRSYFSAEYKAYTDSLSAEIETMRERFGSAAFASVRAALAAQVARAAQWADEATIDQLAIDAALDDAEAAWNGGAAKLRELVARKQARPLEKMDPGLADEAVADYQHALESLIGVNDLLSASSLKAEERKTALSKTDTAEIEERIRRLENRKIRSEPLAQDLLGRRNVLIEKRSRLDAEKTSLKKAIDEQAARVVGKYQNGINDYLKHFGCDIRIESIEPKFPGGKASVHYKLKAHGHEIQLGLSEEGPCFETVLSDGDKYTLALSFFFARLKDHPDLKGRVIVLDDPVNSLGSSRRGLIEGVTRDLRARGAQVVVLTHDERLAAMIWRDKTLKGIVPLELERTGNGSQLKPWDVEHAMQSEYVQNYCTLEDYVNNGGVRCTPFSGPRFKLESRWPEAGRTRWGSSGTSTVVSSRRRLCSKC